MRHSLLFLLLVLGTCLHAQQEDRKPLAFKNWEIRPILGFQGWGTYTMGHRDYLPNTGRYVDADDRLNFMVRRLRFGSTAKVGDRLLIKFLGAADFVGSDQRSGTVGGVNNGGFPVAQIWDVFAQYKLSPKSEGLYVIGGYLRPPIGRESMSGAMGVSSFEKGWVQWYIRQHLVGTGPGGAGGIYLGGLQSFSEDFHVDYRGGVFNAQNNDISAGRQTSPLLVGRVNFMIGDPEKRKWTYGLATANTFGKRTGLSLALNASSEGPTGTAAGGINHLGLDFLFNLRHFHAEGEYHAMNRKDGRNNTLNSSTWMARAGVNIKVSAEGADQPRYLEPSLMAYGFNGATTAAEYATVLATNYFGGEETVIDLGLNYHILPGRVRLSLHYVSTSGNLGQLPPDGRLSWNFRQAGIGGVERGDYVGFEVVLSY